MKSIFYVLAFLAGVALSLEGAMYASLGETIGKLESSLYNFAVGTIILGVALLFFGKGKLSYTKEAPKWQLTGGLLGLIYLTILVVGIPLIGVGMAMSSVVVGQLIMSMVIEHNGWLGSPKVTVRKEKIIAVGLMIVSLFLIY
ncbi:DMT family transporter [Exiguobacterium aestuarii]|uniref:DMT family transporter n=1 Tax=Exiguobacterium aestuarii TaxID=273527 RepID=A0ABW2PK05_9BACL|nr:MULTISPECIES: DMT family transporter [Exiguobacterium]MCT4785088.1 DMT family transporter [Exiguobacterium aestuarii]